MIQSTLVRMNEVRSTEKESSNERDMASAVAPFQAN